MSGLDQGQAWTPQQYCVIVSAVLSSPHKAVPLPEAKGKIGEAALNALVRANLLTYRPPSGRSASDAPKSMSTNEDQCTLMPYLVSCWHARLHTCCGVHAFDRISGSLLTLSCEGL